MRCFSDFHWLLDHYLYGPLLRLHRCVGVVLVADAFPAFDQHAVAVHRGHHAAPQAWDYRRRPSIGHWSVNAPVDQLPNGAHSDVPHNSGVTGYFLVRATNARAAENFDFTVHAYSIYPPLARYHMNNYGERMDDELSTEFNEAKHAVEHRLLRAALDFFEFSRAAGFRMQFRIPNRLSSLC